MENALLDQARQLYVNEQLELVEALYDNIVKHNAFALLVYKGVRGITTQRLPYGIDCSATEKPIVGLAIFVSR